MIVKENANNLAFIGDAILSLLVRTYFIRQGVTNSFKLQKLLVDYTKASSQEKILEFFILNNLLNEQEMMIVNRGKNLKINTKAKNSTVATYRSASALEALFGFLYLYQQNERIDSLFQQMMEISL